MKTPILLLLALLPYMAFSQAMQLPGAQDLSTAPPAGNGNQSLAAQAAVNIGNGTVAAPNRYNASVLSTNFNIPLVRVNFLDNRASGSNSLVSTSFLNSAGAGINYAWGEIDQTKDQSGVTSTEFINRFGIQLGFLFAANTAQGSTTTTTATTTTASTQSSAIFGIMAGISVLNFQLGGGYELGTLSAGQKRGFATIAYAIPVSTLINGGYKIFHYSAITSNTP
jgi:hypothetical protein